MCGFVVGSVVGPLAGWQIGSSSNPCACELLIGSFVLGSKIIICLLIFLAFFLSPFFLALDLSLRLHVRVLRYCLRPQVLVLVLEFSACVVYICVLACIPFGHCGE